MWCDVRRCDLMRRDCLCCVMSRDAMRCHVMCAHVLSYHLLCPAMGWNLRCHSVRSHCVFEVVIQSTILYYKALLCTTKYYSSTTLYYKVVLEYYSSTSLYYKVLLHYYPVLHSTTPVLLCTTKYYSSTTLYYKVLLHYYPLLHRTTPVLLCTTQYYNVLLQYYSVLQSTTPVLLCTTQYYNVLLQYYTVLQSSIHDWSLTHMNRHLHDWCPSHMKRHLQCAEQQESSSNCTKYCTCHAKWLWWLIRVTYETSFTMRGATGVILQLHQILHLPRKMTVMIDPRHIWNVIYNERSSRNHNPSSPNTAPATQNESQDWSASHMKRHLQCGATTVTGQVHQILRLPRKMNLMIDPRHIWNVIYNARSMHRQPPTSPNTAPATKSASSRLQRKLRELLPPIERRFDDNPTIIRRQSEHEIVISHPPLRRPYPSDLEHDFVLKNTTFRAPAISQNVTKCCACHEKWQSNFTKYCACHAKWISRLIRVTYETSFRMRGASKVNLEPHQILRLPRKMNLMIDARLIWNVISNAQQCQPPTSANTAPATKSLSSRLQRKLSELLPPI